MAKKRAGVLSFDIPTTAALVRCTDWRFADMNGEPDSESLSCDLAISFNGLAPEGGRKLVVGRNSSLAQKQSAIRAIVNSLLAETEPGNTLNNANIQIENITQ